MTGRQTSLIAGALVLLLSTALLYALGTQPWQLLIAMLGGLAAMLAAALGSVGTEPTAPPAPPPLPPSRPMPLYAHPEFMPLIEAFGAPVMMIGDGLVLAANSPAKDLLGGFIVGADVRSAIRHPGAVDRLTRANMASGQERVSLVGLGNPDQRWEMRDITMAADQRLVLLTDQTQRDAIDRMRADFVANASHELRTPLASILGYVETLQDDGAGTDAALRARFLGTINSEAQRMQQLVLDLLSMSRVESSKHQPPTDLVALDRLANGVVSQLQTSGDSRSSALALTIEGAIPLAPGDDAQLGQMLHNIISNAMKYGRAGTPILVQVGPVDGSMVRVMVADQSDGIAAEHLPRLTERFYRVDSARSRALGGTGLGLAIVRHIVERHRGELDIASVIGVGTTVTIRLPAAR